MCSRPADPAVIGLWESVNTSRGGIGHTIEFRPDGTFVEATTVIVNMRYRLQGDELFVRESGGKEPAKESATVVKISERTLIQTAPDGSFVEKQRLGDRKSGESGLVGAWRYRHYTGAIAFERYTPGGQLFFRLPLSSSAGCFVSRQSQLTFAGPWYDREHIDYKPPK